MGRHLLEGNPPIEVLLRRSARARSLSLRVSRLDGRVTLTMPNHVADRTGMDFLRSREDWVRHQLTGVPVEEAVGLGSVIPVEGRAVTLTPMARTRPRIDADRLLLPDQPEVAGIKAKAFLRTLARDRLAAASDRYASELGLGYGRITLRDTRSRWGSCTARGDLMYNWRLVMAPTEVLNYVAAHEVAHLAEMNHSRAFWRVVERLFPHHRKCRDWLKDEGATLHRYRFDS